MTAPHLQTPGVYINEVNAFPNSVAPVATAVPAFVGYTPHAAFEGKSYTNVAVKIYSFYDFLAFFGLPDPTVPTGLGKQYDPQYYLVPQMGKLPNADYITLNDSLYAVLPDPNTIYYLYNSVKLFYQNGGAEAYIVSVGGYGAASGKPTAAGTQIVNPNIRLSDLLNGLTILENEEEPTLYICPEATLLSVADNATLMQQMLSQCSELQTAISVFDVIGGRNPDPVKYTDDIAAFRNNTGSTGLDFGTAYYPFVGTTIMSGQDLDYTNLFGGDVRQLEPILNPAGNPNPAAAAVLAAIQNPGQDKLNVTQYNNRLLVASTAYSQIMRQLLTVVNILPASGGMAGVMTTTDNEVGVWEAPANTSIVGVASLPIYLTETQQGGLNVDISGKSINALRQFNGIGILVWGARTLDGYSMDWKYLSVRRTLIYLEQSCKLAARAYVFQPNDKNTWEGIKSMIGSFLMQVWKEGGLMGASASDAFSVACGIGTTMTGDDVINGFIVVAVKVAVVHPAEFITFTFRQVQVG